MSLDDVAQLISERLPTGLPHPGLPELKQPPFVIALAEFRTTGMPNEMAEQIRNTTKLVGEAIVNLVQTESDCELVSKAELATMRADEQRPGAPLAVMCRVCNHPLMWLSVINGRAVVTPHFMAAVNLKCPHTLEEEVPQ